MPHSSHYGSLLIIVRMKVVQEGEADFLIKNVSTLKYGLHFSTVISKRDPLAGGAIEVTFFLTYASKTAESFTFKAVFKHINYVVCKIEVLLRAL
jgi:hypothetical protein